MNVALTGVSGFIGGFIARRLFADGHFVTGLVRPTSRREHVSPFVTRFVVGEQSDGACWGELLDGADCVIHNSVDWDPLRESGSAASVGWGAAGAAFDRHLHTNLVGSIRLLRASAPRQFIYISSISVHHDMRPRWEGRIDEDHPLRPSSPYGAYKAAVEAHLWAEHFTTGRNTSAVRPCGVYGLDPSIEQSLGFDIVRKVKAGERINKPGGGKWVHAEDVAAAVSAMVGNPSVAGRPYNLVDCYARWADWAALAAGVLGKEVVIETTTPPRPQNEFAKDAARSLGVTLDRGHDGIRQHLADLAAAMESGLTAARKRGPAGRT